MEASNTGQQLPRIRLTNLVVAGLLALLTAELVMRLYCFAPRVFDPKFGFVPDPAATVRWHREGHGTSHWRAHGVRVDPRGIRGLSTLLVLGDSLTEAMHVDDDETYSSLLSARLRDRGVPRTVENAGTAGVTIARYVALSATYRELFRPSWTVIQFDASDLAEAWLPTDSHFSRVAPDGPLRVDVIDPLGHGGALRQRIRRARAQSALLQNAVLQLRGIESEWHQWTPFHATPGPTNDRQSGDLAIAQLPIEEELRLVVDAYQGRVSLLFIPTPSNHRDLGPPSATELAIVRLCEAQRWSCPQLRPSFEELSKTGRSPFGFANSGFNVGHFNRDGHAAVADVLADELERLAKHGLL